MSSTKGIGQLGNEICPEHHAQPLLRHVDGGNDIRILGLGREQEALPEDVEAPVASEEAHEVIAPPLGLGQGHARGHRAPREPECLSHPWRAVSGVWPPSLL